MGRWTIMLLRRINPEARLHAAAYMFWISVLLGAASVLFLAQGGYEKVLMAISWGAISVTAIDVVLTADVRKEEEKQ
jgi:hypothetical protein